MSLDLDLLEETETFDILIEGIRIDAAIAPHEDFFCDYDHFEYFGKIDSPSLHGLLRSYRHDLAEILVTKHMGSKYVEIVWINGEVIEHYMLTRNAWSLLKQLAVRDNFTPIREIDDFCWKKEGF